MDDIEASIKKELATLTNKSGVTKVFSPVHLDIVCVLFFKTQPPIDPVKFVHDICMEAKSTTTSWRTRYLNRLTPMTLMGKATESGLEEVGRAVLGAHFQLTSDTGITDEAHIEDKTVGCSVSSIFLITIAFN